MLDTNVNRPDFAWLNESSRIFLHRGYLLEGTEPEDRIRYIANHAEKLLNYPGFADKFYHYMARGYYSLASPIWSNFGLDRGLPISCFGSFIGDSIYDIMSTTAEVGMMSKTGGGTSGYFGAIRPRGAPIKDNGHSDGSFNFAKLFDTVIDVISQGTCYEEGTEVLTDKGFKDFRDVKKGEDLLAHVDEYNNISYTDTYDLITEDHSGEMYHYYAEGKFDLSVTPNHRMVFGGYRYKGEGENIFPDWDEKTDIAQAKDLVLDDYTRLFYLDENTNVQWVVGSDVQVSKVDYQGKVYCATVPLGRLIVRRNNTVCISGNSRKGQFAGYIDIEHPDIEEWLDIHKEGNPIQLMYYGVCIGDQWLKEMKEGDSEKRRIWAKVLQRKAESGIPYLFFKDNVNNQKPDVYKDKDMTIYASNLCCVSGDTTILTKEYGDVPIAEHENEFVTVWNGFEWSPNVQLLKTNTNQRLFLVELSNGKSIRCTDYHKWYIKYSENADPIVKETIDLSPGDRLDTWYLPDSDTPVPDVHVISVTDICEREDVYCCNEPLRHRVVFNGINTGNCEIALPSSLEESFVCCLSSMNALYFDEWKDTDAVETMTYFLDAVMEEFIQKSKSIPMMEKAHRFASRHRAIGIGVLGWHSYLQYKHTPFESFQAMQLNNELFKTIHDRSYAASREIAERYGEPEILKGYGRRNTTTMSVAPTKSSSFILGGVSPSVEPIRSNYYIKDLAKIKTTYRNPLLTKVLQEKGLDNEATWQSILVNDGSVQHLEGLSDEDKQVFKTWQEISQLTIIQQAAQRQKYIDQGQSINILVHPDTPTKDINQLYLTAHELGMKSIYYQFSMSAAQKFNRALLNTCTTCES
jgi:ribonucleoside-diphosphate reductase large chain|nr:MAG TPA: ribonucleotide-diphosphate reductase subunit alpha [Caudoviricetes sp.]